MASMDAVKIGRATPAAAGAGAGSGNDNAIAGDVTAGIAAPATGVTAGASASSNATSGAGPSATGRSLPGSSSQSDTSKLFSQLLNAQHPAAASGANATTTAAKAAAATEQAADGQAPTEQEVDIATLLGELEGAKPAVSTQGTGSAKAAATTNTASKNSAAKKVDDEQEFEGAQSTVLDVQALLRLLEGPVAVPPKASDGGSAADDATVAVSGQGKASATNLAAMLASVTAGANAAAGTGADAAGNSAAVATPAAAPAVSAAVSAAAAAMSALAAPAVTDQSAQLTTDANGTSLVISQTLSAPGSGTDASIAAPVAVERSISVPVAHRDWSPAVAAHVLWQVKSDVQSARVHLTPEGMGPVDVHIDVDGKQVSVNFTAAHVETRQALEQSVPQLRELLAGSGLTLGQTSVQQQSTRQQDSAANANGAGSRDADHNSGESALPVVLGRSGLVDEYA